MTSKTKSNFNQSNKQVYKYNIIKKPTEKFDHLTLLNSIKIDSNSLNGKIDEYYHIAIKFDRKRILHKYQFTIIND